MIIGLLSGKNNCKKYLSQILNWEIIEIPYEIKMQKGSYFPTKFIYKSKEIEKLIVYSHLFNDKRQYNLGIDWIKNFRLKGYNTPLVIFTWHNISKIKIRYLPHNPFISSICYNSCSLIQLPCKVEDILASIEVAKNIEHNEFNKCYDFIFYGQLRHDLTGISNSKQLKTFLYSVIYPIPAVIKKQLVSISNRENDNHFVESLKNIKIKLKQHEVL